MRHSYSIGKYYYDYNLASQWVLLNIRSFSRDVREILMLTTLVKKERRISGDKHIHSFTLQTCILFFLSYIVIKLFLAHKSFANCLATTHLILSLPTCLSAIRTTYSSFHSNGMVSNKSPQSENKCEQLGDTFLSPPSSWLGPIWHQASHCPDGGHFSAPALAHSLPRHRVPVFR